MKRSPNPITLLFCGWNRYLQSKFYKNLNFSSTTTCEFIILINLLTKLSHFIQPFSSLKVFRCILSISYCVIPSAASDSCYGQWKEQASRPKVDKLHGGRLSTCFRTLHTLCPRPPSLPEPIDLAIKTYLVQPVLLTFYLSKFFLLRNSPKKLLAHSVGTFRFFDAFLEFSDTC